MEHYTGSSNHKQSSNQNIDMLKGTSGGMGRNVVLRATAATPTTFEKARDSKVSIHSQIKSSRKNDETIFRKNSGGNQASSDEEPDVEEAAVSLFNNLFLDHFEQNQHQT